METEVESELLQISKRLQELSAEAPSEILKSRVNRVGQSLREALDAWERTKRLMSRGEEQPHPRHAEMRCIQHGVVLVKNEETQEEECSRCLEGDKQGVGDVRQSQ